MGLIRRFFSRKTVSRLNGILEKLSHPDMGDFRKQIGSFDHLQKESERVFAIARKKAEIAMPNISRASVNKLRILNLKSKFGGYVITRGVLIRVHTLATNQQYFLEDLITPLKWASSDLDEARQIFLLKDDPEVNSLSIKLSEVITLAENYDEQIFQQSTIINNCIYRKTKLNTDEKPELWQERVKIDQLRKLLDEMLGSGFDRLNEKIKFFVSAQNVMKKFTIQVGEITAQIQNLIDSIITGEHIYYNGHPLTRPDFFIVMSDYSGALQLVTISDRYNELEGLVKQTDERGNQLSNLNQSFWAINTRRRFPTGIPGLWSVNEEIEFLVKNIKSTKATVDNLIKQRKFRYN